MDQELLSDTFVELADTMVADFDVIDFLHLLSDRSMQLLGASAAGVMLADPRRQLRLSTYPVRPGLVAQEPNLPFLTSPLPRASQKRGITAGQRGGLGEVGSRSLPKPGNGRYGQPKFITKYSCYLQLYGRGGRI